MLKCLNNDSKIQMRQNIKRHRQKLLQYLQKTNDTVLKPKIELIFNDIEKSNFNQNVKQNVKQDVKQNVKQDVKQNVKQDVKQDVKQNVKQDVKQNVKQDVKQNVKQNVKQDVKQNVKQDVKQNVKQDVKQNVKPKIESTAELPNPKAPQTIKITNYRNKSAIQVKTFERVIDNKPKKLKVLLTDTVVKKHKPRSSITVNQLQPKVKVNIQEEPLSSVKLKFEPVPNIEIKDSEPASVIKKLKEQLIEEELQSSSSEDIDDNISVGNNEWNEIYQENNMIDIDEDNSSDSSLIEAVQYDGHKQQPNDKNKKEYMYYSSDSDNPILDINSSTNKKRSRRKKVLILTRSQIQNDQSRYRFRKPLDRSLHNAKERACRERISQKFAILRKSCSYLDSKRRVPSKQSILLAAKKECDLLKHFEKKMLAEKKVWSKANEILRNRIAEYYCK